MHAFPQSKLAAQWRETDACTHGKIIFVTVTFQDKDEIHKADFVLPLNTLQDISPWHTDDSDYRWCASADDLMEKVKKRWNLQYFQWQTKDAVYLFKDTCLYVRDFR